MCKLIMTGIIWFIRKLKNNLLFLAFTLEGIKLVRGLTPQLGIC